MCGKFENTNLSRKSSSIYLSISFSSLFCLYSCVNCNEIKALMKLIFVGCSSSFQLKIYRYILLYFVYYIAVCPYVHVCRKSLIRLNGYFCLLWFTVICALHMAHGIRLRNKYFPSK